MTVTTPPTPPEPPESPAPPPSPSGLPEPGRYGQGSGPERPTYPPLALWDRVKFLLLLTVLFWFFVWAEYSDRNPFNTFNDALNETVRSKWWIFALFGVEALRQIHHLIGERSPRYYHLWTESLFGRWHRRTRLVRDWNRYRIARALKVAVALVLLSIVLGAIYDVHPATALFELPSRIWSWLPLVLQVLLIASLGILQIAGLFWFLSRGGIDTYMPEEIKTRFSDVYGQDPVLERVKENMVFLDRPEVIEEQGGYVPSGILLWGPPGTGKTLMAEAVAGETGKPFVFVDPGAFINMFLGVGILKVKSLFRKLRKLALRYGGVIVFFDEADSLGNRGALTPGPFGGLAGASPMDGTSWSAWSPEGSEHLRWLSPVSQAMVLQHSLGSSLGSSLANEPPSRQRDRIIMGGMGGGGMGTLQALLSELSGLKKPRGIINRYVRRAFGFQPKPPPKYRILVMMATNMPEALDEALLRPGRIDRIYKVGYPSKEGRVRTYQGYLDKVRHDLTDEDVEKLATITPYATGATIKDLVNEALIMAIRDGRDTITWPDIIKAKHLKDLGPPEDVEYIERERHAVAIHEACHAVSAYRVRKHLTIDIATIEKGGTYLGMVASIKPEDQFTRWRSEFEADIMVSLASLAGERLFFDGDSSAGVSGDLQAATAVATNMEGFLGMGQTVASHGVTHRVGIVGGGRPGGDDDSRKDMLSGLKLGDRIESNLGKLLRRTEGLLSKHRADVLRVAHALEANKTLTGDDVIAVIEGDPGPTVDGRAYHEPVFLQQLEQYHEVVVGAHKEHEKVTLELPRANGLQPGPAPDDAIPVPPPFTTPVPGPLPVADSTPEDAP